MKIIKKIIFTISITLVLSFLANAAIIQQGTNTNVTGFTDISVDGNLWDVEFIDSRCVDLYIGCLDGSSATSPFAQDATFADLDNNSNYINGCSSTTHCKILSAYGLDPLNNNKFFAWITENYKS